MVGVLGESTIMSNGLGITAVAALLAAATSVVHGGDYSAIAQGEQSARSVQRWTQASQLSQTAEQAGRPAPLRDRARGPFQCLHSASIARLARPAMPAGFASFRKMQRFQAITNSVLKPRSTE